MSGDIRFFLRVIGGGVSVWRFFFLLKFYFFERESWCGGIMHLNLEVVTEIRGVI